MAVPGYRLRISQRMMHLRPPRSRQIACRLARRALFSLCIALVACGGNDSSPQTSRPVVDVVPALATPRPPQSAAAPVDIHPAPVHLSYTLPATSEESAGSSTYSEYFSLEYLSYYQGYPAWGLDDDASRNRLHARQLVSSALRLFPDRIRSHSCS